MVSNVIAVIVNFDGSIPLEYHAALSVSNLAVCNVMACRVYRKVMLGVIQDEPFSLIGGVPCIPTIQFAPVAHSHSKVSTALLTERTVKRRNSV